MRAIRMKDGETKFIEEITFEEHFPPFIKGDKIELRGEEKTQELIEFYLKSKGVKNSKKNAERFKINCLLGSNGGGKSRIFEWIYNFLNRPSIGEPYGEKYRGIIGFKNYRSIKFPDYPNLNYLYYHNSALLKIQKVIPTVLDKGEYQDLATISDNFFILDDNKWYSLHDNILKGSIALFYCEFFDFLYSGEYKIDFARFLNLQEDFKFYLKFEFEIQFESFNRDFLLWDELDRKFDKEEYQKILNNLCDLYNYFLENKKGENVDIFKGYFIRNIYFLLGIFHYFIEFERGYFLYHEKNENKRLEKLIEIISFCFDWFGIENSFSRIYGEENYLFDYFIETKNENIISYMKFFDISKLKNKYIEDTHEKRLTLDIHNLYDFDKKIGFLTNSNIGKLDFHFDSKSFNNLSSGEKIINIRFINLFSEIKKQNKAGKTDFIILIDEPDLHLHLDWQRRYIQKLIDIFSTLPEDIKIHFIIATHSPFIISDLPGECIIKLIGDGNGNTEVSYMDENQKTFGANYIDLIQNGFFFEHKNLMGSFAENIIGNLAEEERPLFFNGEKNKNPIKENIGDKFLKQNLVYFHKKNNEEN